MQKRHELDPANEYLPDTQRMHAVDENAPVIEPYVPAGHEEHVTAPVNIEYEPHAHALHAELPDVDEYVPTAHDVHDEPVENLPAEHVTVVDVHDTAPDADVVPSAQATHADEPVELE